MTKRLTTDAVLTAIALVIFVAEMQIPPLVPIPGVKLGLANVITVFALYMFGTKDAFFIMLCRLILGSIFTGSIIAFAFSACGAFFCFVIMALLKRVLTENQMWAVSVAGAIFHNIGQITAAIFILANTAIIAYLPFLLVSGVITGLFTGLTAQVVFKRLRKHLFLMNVDK